MLTSTQRAYLRAEAHSFSPIFQIGKGGITEEICLQLSNALEARELIKVRTLENCDFTARGAANAISEEIGADVVAVLGSTFILYRRSEKKPRYILPK